jgi:hypothetical protein
MEGSRTATILIEYHLSYIEYHLATTGAGRPSSISSSDARCKA